MRQKRATTSYSEYFYQLGYTEKQIYYVEKLITSTSQSTTEYQTYCSELSTLKTLESQIRSEIVNTCHSSYCSLCSNHVACGSSGVWNANCPADAELINLAGVRDVIVAVHNDFRNQVASGSQPGFKSAAKMQKLVKEKKN